MYWPSASLILLVERVLTVLAMLSVFGPKKARRVLSTKNANWLQGSPGSLDLIFFLTNQFVVTVSERDIDPTSPFSKRV